MIVLNNDRRRITLNRHQFDDCLITINTQLRFDEHADHVLSGIDRHPLEVCQIQSQNVLDVLRIPFIDSSRSEMLFGVKHV